MNLQHLFKKKERKKKKARGEERKGEKRKTKTAYMRKCIMGVVG